MLIFNVIESHLCADYVDCWVAGPTAINVGEVHGQIQKADTNKDLTTGHCYNNTNPFKSHFPKLTKTMFVDSVVESL